MKSQASHCSLPAPQFEHASDNGIRLQALEAVKMVLRARWQALWCTYPPSRPIPPATTVQLIIGSGEHRLIGNHTQHIFTVNSMSPWGQTAAPAAWADHTFSTAALLSVLLCLLVQLLCTPSFTPSNLCYLLVLIRPPSYPCLRLRQTGPPPPRYGAGCCPVRWCPPGRSG